jgi:hypothetical protein
MQSKIVKFEDFKSGLRDALLAAADAYIREVMETEKVDGWKDEELPALFSGVDSHAKALAARINAGHEANSALVRIEMQE